MESWKTISDYPNYEVSDQGRVRNRLTDKVLKQANIKGYRRVVLCDDTGHHPKTVHRLVADAFYDGNHEGLQVNHIDGNKSNNHVSNLEWCTSSENRLHAFRTGLQKSSQSKKVKIVETGEIFESMTECAKHINGDMKQISACVRGCQHTHRGRHFQLVADENMV